MLLAASSPRHQWCQARVSQQKGNRDSSCLLVVKTGLSVILASLSHFDGLVLTLFKNTLLRYDWHTKSCTQLMYLSNLLRVERSHWQWDCSHNQCCKSVSPQKFPPLSLLLSLMVETISIKNIYLAKFYIYNYIIRNKKATHLSLISPSGLVSPECSFWFLESSLGLSSWCQGACPSQYLGVPWNYPL